MMQHGFGLLFLGESFGCDFAVFIFTDHYVLRGRDQAMLDSTIATQRFLVSPGMEKADIKGFTFTGFGHEHLVVVRFGVVVIKAIARESTYVYTPVFIAPLVDGQ